MSEFFFWIASHHLPHIKRWLGRFHLTSEGNRNFVKRELLSIIEVMVHFMVVIQEFNVDVWAKVVVNSRVRLISGRKQVLSSCFVHLEIEWKRNIVGVRLNSKLLQGLLKLSCWNLHPKFGVRILQNPKCWNYRDKQEDYSPTIKELEM